MDKLLNIVDKHIQENNTLESAIDIVKNFDLSNIDLSNYYKFDRCNYTRNIVCQTNNVQIIVICWNILQKSPIHNHPENGCILKVLSGNLIEKKYDINDLKKISESTLKVNNIGYIDNRAAYHCIENPSFRQKAISLHIYSPTEFTPTIYEEC